MRVPRPGTLKLEQAQLLLDVRERLAARLPEYGDAEVDPTDPGWLLLEQAAWLVEVLSEQLDQYPYAVIQQVLHMVGGPLLPAHPSCGVVVAEVGRPGALVRAAGKMGGTRLFTPQNENNDVIEFVPVESDVVLGRGRIVSLVEWDGEELYLSAGQVREDRGAIEGLVAWRGERRRSRRFDGEVVTITLVTNKVDDTVERVTKTLEMLAKRDIGWLGVDVRAAGTDRVEIDLRIDLASPFHKTVPGGVTEGGDVPADWGTVDDSTWTPPVRVARHPLLPWGLRGTRPYPGAEDGQIIIPDVPANFPAEQLLELAAAPMSTSFVEATWATLGNLNTRLAALRPSFRRKYAEAEDPEEPSWVAAAIDSGVWSQIVRHGARQVVHVDGVDVGPDADRFRLALVAESGGVELSEVDIYEVTAEGQVPNSPLDKRVAFTMPAVTEGESGRGVDVVALDVRLESTTTGLLVVSRPLQGVFCNALLVANLPAVADGRTALVQRNVPEPVTLLHEDVVTADVIEQLLERPLPPDAAAALRALPLAHFQVEGQEPLENWEGIAVEPTDGLITLNAPDPEGRQRALRPGASLVLDWYRRTDGRWGNVGAGEINLVEQAPGSVPSIVRVSNPLGAVFGEDREEPRAAVDRLFGPGGETPVTAADFERVFRQALGPKAEGWTLRVWSYAERALVTTALWPFERGVQAGEPSTMVLTKALAAAGPDTLLVVLGPTDRPLNDLDFEQARAVILKRVDALRRRVPAIRHAVVGRLWPLELKIGVGDEAPELPCWDSHGLKGELVDSMGRRAPPPPQTLLLNAIVTRAVEDRGGWT